MAFIKHLQLLIGGLLLFGISMGQKLEKIWETDSIFPVPESVLYYSKTNQLFVSNIDGSPSAKDGKGSLARLNADGSTSAANWATGLNAPKGMGFYGNELYVADADVLRIYNISTAKQIDSVAITGAVFLNDVTVDDSGNVYISDSRTGTIHKVNAQRNQQAFISGLKGPNGLLWHNSRLYYADRGQLWYRSAAGQVVKVAEGMDASTDGIVAVDGDAFVVSCWVGIVYHVAANGTLTTMLDLKAEKVNTADIGYNPSTKTVFIPTFFKNKVMAYRFLP
ncbi:MAG: ATP/GTP-binding protein [Bacteroidetes bacterium]|nr:MAG: ATP/GTP-binding protein [Bacteroidota bacterium]